MSDRKQIFFTADYHLGHKNIITYDNRPFRDVHHMHQVLINNYNSTISKDSICYFLGDMGMCSTDIVKSVLDHLNGTKVLILGNHDKGINAMYRAGFAAVMYGMYLQIANEQVSLTHCPLRKTIREDVSGMKGAKDGEAWHGESRNNKFSITDNGQFHLHGHVHSKSENKILNRQFDVGVRANNYTPVNISAIERWIASAMRGGK